LTRKQITFFQKISSPRNTNQIEKINFHFPLKKKKKKTDFLPKEEKADEEEKKDFSGMIQGAKMIVKKKDAGALQAATTKKSKKQKTKKQAVKIVHTNGTLKDFADIKIAVPMTTDDVRIWIIII
jgi:hypothetical protein